MPSTLASYYSLHAGRRILIGVIADVETTLGFLLAGIGEADSPRKRNYMLVDADTAVEDIERFFFKLYDRRNIGVIFVGTDIMDRIFYVKEKCDRTLPIILEIPTKSSIMQSLQLKEGRRK